MHQLPEVVAEVEQDQLLQAVMLQDQQRVAEALQVEELVVPDLVLLVVQLAMVRHGQLQQVEQQALEEALVVVVVVLFQIHQELVVRMVVHQVVLAQQLLVVLVHQDQVS
jgi:hypothetical protein